MHSYGIHSSKLKITSILQGNEPFIWSFLKGAIFAKFCGEITIAKTYYGLGNSPVQLSNDIALYQCSLEFKYFNALYPSNEIISF